MSNHYFIENKLNGDVIDVQGASTASGTLVDASPKKTSDTDNQLWEFVADPGGSGFYFIKSKLDGNVLDILNDSTSPGALLDVNPQKTSDLYSQLWQFFEDPAGSGYSFIMSAYYGYVIDVQGASKAPGTFLDVYPQKPTGNDNQLWRVIDGAFPATEKVVAAPSEGLISNFNYFFTDHGKPLTGVEVQVTFQQDFVSTINGYSFQLNCYSTEGPTITTEWQQFVIYADPGSTQLWARIDTWSGTALSDELNRIDTPLANLPSTTIPAGYSFTILLGFDGSNGAGTITSAVYQLVDNNGTAVGNAEITIVGHILRTTGKPATVGYLAPIAAFQFNIGGYGGSKTATLSEGGWGTACYRANNSIHPLTSEPTSYTDFDDGTGESANLIFGAVPGTPNQLFRQWFQVTSASEPRKRSAMTLPDGRPRHMLSPRDDLSLGRSASPHPN